MLLVTLPVNSKILAVKFWENQESYMGFQLHKRPVLLIKLVKNVHFWVCFEISIRDQGEEVKIVVGHKRYECKGER